MLALALCLVPQAPAPEALVPESLGAWRRHLAPQAAEQRWREIPWRQTMGDGLRDAARNGKPMLLWLMNGHPLGCT